MITVTINPRVDQRNYYNLIEGTREENIFCALLGLGADPKVPLSAEQFLKVYIKMAKWVFNGISNDYKKQPHLEGSKLLADISALKGVENNLLERSVFLRITDFLTSGNKQFCAEAGDKFTEFES